MVNWLLANFFAKPKNQNQNELRDLTSSLIFPAIKIREHGLAWLIDRAGELCAVMSKGGDSMSRFPGKICSSYAERVHEMPHTILLDLFSLTRNLLGAPLGALGCPSTGVPVRKDELLAATFFGTKVLHFCMAV